METFDIRVKAFCFNIYEDSPEGDYSIELTAFEEYDEYDEDWNSGGTETYASRNDDNELAFKYGGGWEKCLSLSGKAIENYLKNGQFADKLKSADIVGYGFVDGDCEIAFKK